MAIVTATPLTGTAVAARLTSRYCVDDTDPRTLCVPTVDPRIHVAETDPSAPVVSVVDAAPLIVPPPAVTAAVKLLLLAGLVVPSLSFSVTVNAMRIEVPTSAVAGGAVLINTV